MHICISFIKPDNIIMKRGKNIYFIHLEKQRLFVTSLNCIWLDKPFPPQSSIPYSYKYPLNNGLCTMLNEKKLDFMTENRK